MIILKVLRPEDVTKKYIDWYESKEVVKYSDNQYRNFSLENQINYVDSCFNNQDIELYGIFDDKKHIGNMCLSGLVSFHFRAEISYVIGDTTYWGKGIATMAVNLIIKVALEKYSLHKLFAGVSSMNKGSQKVLLNSGFVLEGIRKDHLFYNNQWNDQYDYGLLLKNKK